MSEILELGADGSFDVSTEPVNISKSVPLPKVKVSVESKEIPPSDHLIMLLSQIRVGGYKIVDNTTSSSFIVLARLQAPRTIVSVGYNPTSNNVEVTSERNDVKTQCDIPVPIQNAKKESVSVYSSVNLSCNVHECEDGTVDIVVCIPYSSL